MAACSSGHAESSWVPAGCWNVQGPCWSAAACISAQAAALCGAVAACGQALHAKCHASQTEAAPVAVLVRRAHVGAGELAEGGVIELHRSSWVSWHSRTTSSRAGHWAEVQSCAGTSAALAAGPRQQGADLAGPESLAALEARLVTCSCSGLLAVLLLLVLQVVGPRLERP